MTVTELARLIRIPIPSDTDPVILDLNKETWTAVVFGLIYCKMAASQRFDHKNIQGEIEEIFDEFKEYLEQAKYYASPTKILLFGLNRCVRCLRGVVLTEDHIELEQTDAMSLVMWGKSIRKLMLVEKFAEPTITGEMMTMLEAFIRGKIERSDDETDWRHFVIIHVESLRDILNGVIPIRFEGLQSKSTIIDPKTQLP